MQIKLQGNFKELINGMESSTSIFDFIEEKPSEDEEKIVNYLKNGIVIIACGGIMVDVINPEKGLAGCPEIRTDGIWAWTGDLEYYVSEYHLRLDEEFISTMKKNNWIINKELDIDFDEMQIVF